MMTRTTAKVTTKDTIMDEVLSEWDRLNWSERVRIRMQGGRDGTEMNASARSMIGPEAALCNMNRRLRERLKSEISE